jgi:bifunctional DNA-binding transcriptional regulator/antitoxin component of YhaV-PrlF toxin-antitoxin module
MSRDFSCQGKKAVLDYRLFKDYHSPVITRITGKNQVTVPAEIVDRAGLRVGTRLDWRTTDREGVLEVRVVPSPASIAAGLRGRGNRFGQREGSAVDRLLRDREQEEDAGS